MQMRFRATNPACTRCQKAQVMAMVFKRIDSAAAADLPAMVLYLIKHATQSTAREVSPACCIDPPGKFLHCCSDWDTNGPQVAQTMRQKLRFAISADPRSAGAACFIPSPTIDTLTGICRWNDTCCMQPRIHCPVTRAWPARRAHPCRLCKP